jgi:hypothetical protein
LGQAWRLADSWVLEALLLPCSELLDGPDQVCAVHLTNSLKHTSRSVLSELPGQSAREGLLLCLAAPEGHISHTLGRAAAPQISFGRGCHALHPLIPKLLDLGGQHGRAQLLGCGWVGLRQHGRSGRIGPRRGACEQGEDERNSRGSHAGIEPKPSCTVKLYRNVQVPSAYGQGLMIRLRCGAAWLGRAIERLRSAAGPVRIPAPAHDVFPRRHTPTSVSAAVPSCWAVRVAILSPAGSWRGD